MQATQVFGFRRDHASQAGGYAIVQAASRDAKTHMWSAPTSLSLAGRDAQTPSVAVNARGDAVAVWASVSLSGWTVQAAYRPAGGAWQATVPIQTPQVATASPDVVIDPTGRVKAYGVLDLRD